MFSLFSSPPSPTILVATGVGVASVLCVSAGARPDVDVRDSVTTREASVVIGGAAYRQVQFEGHDYFLKEARPGSALVEVRCQTPSAEAGAAEPKKKTPPALAVASRSREFVDKLQDGCAPKEGVSPERFTFEQRANQTAKVSQDAVKPKRKVELLGPNSFPSDLDPHVLPDPAPAGGNFDRNQKRY